MTAEEAAREWLRAEFANALDDDPDLLTSLTELLSTRDAARDAEIRQPLLAMIRRLAIVKHVRPTYSGMSVDNGYSCRICKAECGHGEELAHASDCPLISPAPQEADTQ